MLQRLPPQLREEVSKVEGQEESAAGTERVPSHHETVPSVARLGGQQRLPQHPLLLQVDERRPSRLQDASVGGVPRCGGGGSISTNQLKLLLALHLSPINQVDMRKV
jgi:hypothetical protein